MKKITEQVEYDSTLIKSSDYNFVQQELNVTFVNGAIYKYYDVTEIEYQTFSTAESLGKEFSVSIKSKKFDKLN